MTFVEQLEMLITALGFCIFLARTGSCVMDLVVNT
jgi:hypothetical protein